MYPSVQLLYADKILNYKINLKKEDINISFKVITQPMDNLIYKSTSL
jgi:hypothetical protein